MALASAGTAILAPILAATRAYASLGDQIDKTSARTGASAQFLSELGFAAEQNGSNLATVEKGFKGLQTSVLGLERGLSTQVDLFGRLGLSVQDFKNLNAEQQFELVADRLAAIEQPTTRAAIATGLLGRAGQQLGPLLAQGVAGIAALRQEARDLNITLSQADATKAAELTDAMNRVRRSVQGVVLNVGQALAPILTDIFNRFAKAAAAVSRFVEANQGVIVGIAGAAAAAVAAGTAIAGLGTALVAVGSAAIALPPILSAAFATFSAVAGGALAVITSPLTLTIGLLTAGAAAWLRWTSVGQAAVNQILSVLAGLRRRGTAAIQGIVDALATGDLRAAASIAANFLRVEINRALIFLEARFGGFITFAIDTFNSVRDAVVDGWRGVTGFLIGAWDNAVDFIGSLASSLTESLSNGFESIGNIFGDATDGMFSDWQSFVGGVRKLWTQAVNFIAQSLLRVGGALDRLLQNISGGRINLGLEEIRQGAIATLNEDLDRELTRIDRQTQAARTRSRRLSADRTDAARERLAQAQRRQRELIDAAREQRERQRADRDTGAEAAASALADASKSAVDQVTSFVRGTFSGAAASLLAVATPENDSTDKRMANALESIDGKLPSDVATFARV